MNAPLRYLVLTTTVVIAGLALGLQLKSKVADPQKQFIGQEACISCHTGQYGDGRSYAGAAAFRETMHQKIHLRPNPQTVVIDRLFAKDTVLKFYESRIPQPPHDTLEIHLSKGAKETDYYIQMKFSNGGDSTQKMKVAYTYGGNGWIQRYLLEVNGSLYVAPFQYSLPHYMERSDTAVNGFYFLDLTRWYTFTNDREGKFYDITSKVFKAQSWQMNCAPCHVNGFQADRIITPTDSTADTSYAMKWFGVAQGDSALTDQNIKIGCESCHGPGSAHAANPTDSTAIISPSRWAADGPGQFTNLNLKVDLCGQCHNRMKSTGLPTAAPLFQFAFDEVNMQPYTPGQPLKNFVADGNLFKGMNVWGDDTTSYAHHQQGQDFLRSIEYSKHSLVNGCWSCHTVHFSNKDGLPFQLRNNYYSLNKGEGCLAYGCHETMDETTVFKGQTVNKHTMHTVESSQCVFCHFTKTASISFVDLPRKPLYDFTDHSLKVLRPSLTRKYMNYGAVGMLNTCAEACHRNGRGSRNSDAATMPEAPSYNIVDKYLSIWNNKSDVDLADSLEAHWSELFPASATMESSVASATGIQSIAPNPTQSSSTIRFSLAKGGDITLAIYDTEGNLISLVASGRHEAGTFSQVWNGTDETGVKVASGTYLVRLVTKQGVSTQRLVIAR